MITMLDEQDPAAEKEEAKDPKNFINQMMNAFGGCHQKGGRGGRGGRHCGRGGRGGGPPMFQKMI